MKGIKGIDRITSRSYENAASITIELDKGVDAYTSLQEIKNAVDAVTGLPGDMENPIVAVVENAPSTMNFTVSGEGLDLRTLKLKARDTASSRSSRSAPPVGRWILSCRAIGSRKR